MTDRKQKQYSVIQSRTWRRILNFSCGSAIIAMILAYLFYLLSSFIYSHSDRLQQHTIDSMEKSSQSLQEYADQNGLYYADYETIRSWQKQTDTSIYFYGSKEELQRRIREDAEYTNSESRRLWRMKHAVPIRFADETVYAYLDNRHQVFLRAMNNLLSFFLAIVVYSLSMLIFMRADVEYMMYLKDELQLMRGGDLTRSIAILQNHELGDIGEEIDALRQDFAGQIQKEHEAVTSNHELIASVSHDLRTPLTRLIGYLEILKLKKYEDSSQFQNYVDKANSNAFVIRDVTDQLFHYFTAYKHEELDNRLQRTEGSTYLNEILADRIDYLKSRRFEVTFMPLGKPFFLRVDKMEFPRIFDNLFQNMERYADREHPVLVTHGLEEGKLVLQFENVINTETGAESTGLGLKIVDRIVSMVNGSMDVEIRDNIYVTRLVFPVVTAEKKD